MTKVKFTLYLLFSLLAINSLVAQVNLEWVNRLNPGTNNNGFFHGMAIDNNGDVCIAGETYNNTGSGAYSVAIAKYTTTGTSLWSSTFAFPSGVYQYVRGGVGVDAANNIYISGYTYNANPSNYSNYNNLFVLKYDPNGNLLWSRSYDSGTNDYMDFPGIIVDPNGDVVIAGTHSNNITNNYTDILFLKYDGSGNLLWSKIVDAGTSEYVHALGEDASGNIFASFQSYDNLNVINTIGVVKLDPAGNQKWYSSYAPVNGESASNYYNCLTIDPSGNAIASGYVSYPNATSNYYDALTVKFDQNGNQSWAQKFDGGMYDYYGSVETDSKGNIFMATNSTMTHGYVNLVKYDPSGNVIWTTPLYNNDNSQNSFAWNSDITVDEAGNAFLTGYGTSGGNYNFYNIQTAKVNADGTIGWTANYPTAVPANSVNYYSYGYDVDLDAHDNIFVFGMDYNYTNASDNPTNTILTLKYNQPAAGLNFDGVDDYVSFGPNPSLNNLGKGMTLEAWINPADVTNVNSIIRKTGDYNLYVSGGTLHAEVWPVGGGDSGWKLINGTTAISANTWTHVTVSWDGSNAILYVNGIVDPSSMSSGNVTGSENLYLGMSSIYGQHFSGTMDEVRIWSRPLCQPEVQNSMKCELSGPQTGLAAYFQFNEGVLNSDNTSITTLSDASGNSNLGTLTNFALTGSTSNWVAGAVSGSCSPFVPTASITPNGPLTFNAPGSVVLTANTGSSYLWSTGATSQAITVSSSGNYSVTVNYTGGCSAIAAATVSVIDTIKPVANCRSITIQLDATGHASITAAQVDNGSSDNNAIASMSVAPNVFSCSSTGTNSVTLTVTDLNGNFSTCTSTVTVQDNMTPVAMCQNISVALDASGHAVVTPAQINHGSSDNCSISSMTVSPNSFTCANVGANPVVFVVTDASGNSASCNAVVTVTDNTAPIVICQNVTIALDASGNASVTAAQVNKGSSDNCGIASMTVSPSVFTCNNAGANSVILKVTDTHGNSSSCTATVTVVDNTLPVAICKPATVTISHGAATIKATDINNGSYDNCGIASISVVPSTFTCSDIGTRQVTLTVTDVHGNKSSCQSAVTVKGVAPSCSISSKVCCSGDDDGHHSDGEEGSHSREGEDGHNTSPNITQLYLGYGAQTLCLNVTATGGSAYTYSWSGAGLSCTQSASPKFTPTAQGTYTISVTSTNEYGCSSSCSIVICVLDIRVPNRCGMVYVCHANPDHLNQTQTVIMSSSQAGCYLSHYPADHLGKCGQTCGANGREDSDEVIEELGQLNVMAFPNPFLDDLHVRLETSGVEEITIRVYGIRGELIQTLNNVKPEQDIHLGDELGAGMYFLEVQQGNSRKMLKVKKMK
jgi:hypothetical protein